MAYTTSKSGSNLEDYQRKYQGTAQDVLSGKCGLGASLPALKLQLFPSHSLRGAHDWKSTVLSRYLLCAVFRKPKAEISILFCSTFLQKNDQNLMLIMGEKYFTHVPGGRLSFFPKAANKKCLP